MASLPPPPRAARARPRRHAERAFVSLAACAATLLLASLAALCLVLASEVRSAPSAPGAALSLRYGPAIGAFGLGGLLASTLASLVVATLVAVPIGLGAAIYTAELAPRSVARLASAALDGAASVPGVLYGAWALVAWMPALGAATGGPGHGPLSAGLVLGAMAAPTIASIAHGVLAAVPATPRDVAVALGATRWEAVRGAVLPIARRGLVGAIWLGFARAAGETVAVAMLVGGLPAAAPSVLGPSATLGSVLVDEYLDASAPRHVAALALAGALLLVIASGAHLVGKRLVDGAKGAA